MARSLSGLLGLFLLTAVVGADTGKPASSADDKQKLQGTWTVGDAKRGDTPVDELKNDRLLFDGSTVQVKSGGRSEAATFTLDATHTPKTIDLIGKAEKDKPVLGIYSLEGDNLKLWIGRPGEDRPADFTPKSTTKVLQFILKREPQR